MAMKEDIKDFGTKPLTLEDVQEQTRIYMEKYIMNSVRIAGTVVSVKEGEPKPKFKKDDKGEYTTEHLLDSEGNIQFWETSYSANITFDGGELYVRVTKNMFDSLILGSRYLFTGIKGLSYGSIQDKFHSCIKL
jgi:hypothetical protein